MRATQFVEMLYSRFPGRVPVAVAGNIRVGNVYPFVHTSDVDGPIALIACLPKSGDTRDTVVEVAHLSTLKQDVCAQGVRDWISAEASAVGVGLEFKRDASLRDAQNFAGDTRLGPRFIHGLQQLHPWRVPISVGLTIPGGHLFPSVVHSEAGHASGLVGCGWNENADADLVQVYHVSAFQKLRGDGTNLVKQICSLADEVGTRLYVQAQPLFDDGDSEIPQDVLVRWYQGFGFQGSGPALIRRPRSSA